MSHKLKLILGAVGLVVFAGLVWFFLLSPIRGDISATEAEIGKQQQTLTQAQLQLKQAETTREEGKKNQARLMELAKLMPTDEEVPSMLLQLQDLADQAGIKFISITPGDTEPQEKADYRILPLDLEFEGTFFDISDFIYRVEQMAAGPGRLLAVKDLSLELGDTETAGPGVSPPLNVSVQMYTFLAGGGTVKTAPATAPAAGDTTTTTVKK